MGNGQLYVYKIYPGELDLLFRARVIANLGNLKFREAVAKIRTIDQNRDGKNDVEISATLQDTETGKSHPYYRLFLGESGGLREKREAARGLADISQYGY